MASQNGILHIREIYRKCSIYVKILSFVKTNESISLWYIMPSSTYLLVQFEFGNIFINEPLVKRFPGILNRSHSLWMLEFSSDLHLYWAVAQICFPLTVALWRPTSGTALFLSNRFNFIILYCCSPTFSLFFFWCLRPWNSFGPGEFIPAAPSWLFDSL